MRHPRKRPKTMGRVKPLPTGFTFTMCSCCARKLGGSTTDPLKMCSTCETAKCSKLTVPQGMRVERH